MDSSTLLKTKIFVLFLLQNDMLEIPTNILLLLTINLRKRRTLLDNLIGNLLICVSRAEMEITLMILLGIPDQFQTPSSLSVRSAFPGLNQLELTLINAIPWSQKVWEAKATNWLQTGLYSCKPRQNCFSCLSGV